MKRVTVSFELTNEQRVRFHAACRALGTSYPEFIRFATMQAVDEVEGYGRDAEAVRLYYDHLQTHRSQDA